MTNTQTSRTRPARFDALAIEMFGRRFATLDAARRTFVLDYAADAPRPY